MGKSCELHEEQTNISADEGISIDQVTYKSTVASFCRPPLADKANTSIACQASVSQMQVPEIKRTPANMPCIPVAKDETSPHADQEILSLLGQGSSISKFPDSTIPDQAAIPEEFRHEVESRLAQGRVTDTVARYYLEVLTRGDSRRVPGRNGRPSLLNDVLVENVQALTNANRTGRGWRPMRAIGKGAYGSVILWEKKQKNSSPIRLASKDSLCSPFFKDYCAEAQLTRRLNDLNCKNVINVVEWAYVRNPTYRTPNGTVYRTDSKNRILYEFAEYADLTLLEQWYKSQGLILPEAFIWYILYSVASALCYCRHGANFVPPKTKGPNSRSSSPARVDWDTIVHGDIKQENIFMTTPDEEIHRLYPTLKLADFGLAYTMGGPVTAVQHFRSCHHYGTDGYIAPEIADCTPEQNLRRRMPHELHGPHSDTYSLGMTCKHLIRLIDLHRSESSHHKRSKSSPEQSHDENNLNSFYSDELRSILQRCVAKDPRDRPKTYKLYLEAKAQMELHRDMAYAEATAATQGENTGDFFHSRVLYTEAEQRRYEMSSAFREEYRRANLGPLWMLIAEKVALKPEARKERPKLIKFQSFRNEKGKDGKGGEGIISSLLKKSASWVGPSHHLKQSE